MPTCLVCRVLYTFVHTFILRARVRSFGCAMHPTQRASWAAGWARAIAPGGHLLAIVFPVDAKMDPNFGPPYPVTPDLYKSLLEPAGVCVCVATSW